jgi:stage III sporulation protein AH
MFMKVIKRNQIIIFVGALMLIVAGYLNFSDNGLPINNLVPTSTLADAEEMASIGDAKLVSANVVDGEQENEIQDIVNNNDLNDSVIETNTEADIKNNDKNVSENITESSTTETSSNNIESVNKDKQLNNNYFTQSRLDRDTMYSQTLDTYQKIIENESISADQKAIAQKEISKINEQKNSIMIAENLIKVKGFEDLIIFINGENVSVIVKSDKLEEKEIAQIQNIVTRELGVKIENINISNK